jgi:polyhydroxyalkanoate synthesis regulator phasin
MNDLVLKLLYNAVGTMAVSTAKLKELLEDLIQNGPYTEDEGKRIVQQLNIELEEKRIQLQGKINTGFEQVLNDIQAPVKKQVDKMVADLKEKIKTLPLGDAFIK